MDTGSRLGLAPHAPRSLAAVPEFLEQVLVPQRIHVLPIAGMAVDRELILRHEPAHGILLPDRVVAVDEIEDARLQDEESAIDQVTIRSGLLPEAQDPGPIGRKIEGTETSGLRHRG